MSRGLVILGAIVLGAVLGFAVGLTIGQQVANSPGMAEAEYMGAIFLGAFGGLVVGAVIGGIAAARLSRS